MAKRHDISAEYARQLLDYDPEAGILIWKARTPDMFKDGKRFSAETNCKRWNTQNAGTRAGTKDIEGYLFVRINGRSHYAAFLAWLIHFGTPPHKKIRFLSDDVSNLKISNLRESYSDEEVRQRSREASERWRSEPKNKESQADSCARYRKQPHAKEKHRIRQLDYAARNREQERKRAEEWRKADPVREAESKRKSYLKHYEKRRAKSKQHYLENRDACREYSSDYNARRRGGGGRLSKGRRAELMTLQNGLCAACECDLSISGHHLDHIVPLARGGLHCDENVQLLCPTCNNRKHAKSFEEFLQILRKERDERTSLSETSGGG